MARESGAQQGGLIDILGKEFKIARILSETGSTDDIRAYGLLSEFQEILNMKGKINEIMALNCLCLAPDDGDPLVVRLLFYLIPLKRNPLECFFINFFRAVGS